MRCYLLSVGASEHLKSTPYSENWCSFSGVTILTPRLPFAEPQSHFRSFCRMNTYWDQTTPAFRDARRKLSWSRHRPVPKINLADHRIDVRNFHLPRLTSSSTDSGNLTSRDPRRTPVMSPARYRRQTVAGLTPARRASSDLRRSFSRPVGCGVGE